MITSGKYMKIHYFIVHEFYSFKIYLNIQYAINILPRSLTWAN